MMAPASQAKRISAPVFIACSVMMPASSRPACCLGLEVERLAAGHAAAPAARARPAPARPRRAGSDRSRAIGDDVEGQRQQRVAGQDGGRLVEGLVHGRLAAAQIVVVHRRQVVMDEGIAVHAFERRADAQARPRRSAPNKRAHFP